MRIVVAPETAFDEKPYRRLLLETHSSQLNSVAPEIVILARNPSAPLPDATLRLIVTRELLEAKKPWMTQRSMCRLPTAATEMPLPPVPAPKARILIERSTTVIPGVAIAIPSSVEKGEATALTPTPEIVTFFVMAKVP